MKLNWLRAGCASIAEGGTWSFATHSYDKYGTCGLTIRNTADGELIRSQSGFTSREAAEAACEAWLDQNDNPVWHDATEWLSWAEWRGHKIAILPSEFDDSFVARCRARSAHFATTSKTIEGAKAAAERYVREQTGGAA